VNSSDPITGTSDGDLGPDWEVVDANHLKLRAEKANNGQARYYTISANVSDGCNAPVVAAVTVVVAHNITGPQTGNSYKIGSTVSLNGSFWINPATFIRQNGCWMEAQLRMEALLSLRTIRMEKLAVVINSIRQVFTNCK
jgi:hypothetical protein